MFFLKKVLWNGNLKVIAEKHNISQILSLIVVLSEEQVFQRAFCVCYAAFRSLELLVWNNEFNSTIFLFSRFHQISVDVVLCQNTQNIITFMVRWEIFPTSP